MDGNSATFLNFNAEITGYSAVDLEGTGLVAGYQQLLEGALGENLTKQFYALANGVLAYKDPAQRENEMRTKVLPSTIFWPIVANLIALWYLGTWTVLPDTWYIATGMTKPGVGEPGSTHVPSAQAYIEQLSYRTAGAHTPGAKPTGYASWSIPPVF